MGLAVFMRRDGFAAALSQLTGLSTVDCQQRLVYTSGPVPMLCLEYFDEAVNKHAELGDELWLQGFVTRFLGELIFSHGQLTVAIEVAEIALTVMTQQIDLAPVILAETYCGLDHISHCCRHFYGCGHSYRFGWPNT